MSKVRLENFDASIGLDRGANKIKEIIWYCVKIIFFTTILPFPNKLKVLLLKLFGARIGKGVVIKPRVNIHMPWKLVVGNYVWIGEEAFLLNFELLSVGNNVCISQRAFLCGGNHDFRNPAMPYRNGPITLMDGSWVGAGCFIGPNVKVGIDSVIAAGSVLTQSVDGNGIYRGNPAIFISERWK